MSSRGDSDLQRYFDGELSRRKARRVHERLESDPADRARLESLGQLRELVQATAEAAADEADFSGLWGRVASGIEQSGESRHRLWRRAFGWAAVAASATAAVVFAMVFWAFPAPTSNDCVIESLEVGSGAVSTIFTIEDPDTLGATTVIWVSDRTAEGSLE